MRGSAFFEDVEQVQLSYAGQTAGFPIFYFDGSSMTAIFPARLSALRRLLPDSRFVPARLAPGLGTVGVTCFEYRDTDIGAYNELAISIPLSDPPHLLNLPGRALAAAYRRRQLHAFVHHLPVTTDVALAGGQVFYNFPKFVANIDFTTDGDRWSCRLAEGVEHILTLSGLRIPTPRSQELQLFSHLWMGRQPQSAEFRLNCPELGVSAHPSAAQLELGGRHPIARELDGLLVSRRPLQYQYMPRFEGILFGPEHLTFPLLERTRRALGHESVGAV